VPYGGQGRFVKLHNQKVVGDAFFASATKTRAKNKSSSKHFLGKIVLPTSVSIQPSGYNASAFTVSTIVSFLELNIVPTGRTTGCAPFRSLSSSTVNRRNRASDLAPDRGVADVDRAAFAWGLIPIRYLSQIGKLLD